jgi:hypothetical protein
MSSRRVDHAKTLPTVGSSDFGGLESRSASTASWWGLVLQWRSRSHCGRGNLQMIDHLAHAPGPPRRRSRRPSKACHEETCPERFTLPPEGHSCSWCSPIRQRVTWARPTLASSRAPFVSAAVQLSLRRGGFQLWAATLVPMALHLCFAPHKLFRGSPIRECAGSAEIGVGVEASAGAGRSAGRPAGRERSCPGAGARNQLLTSRDTRPARERSWPS